ncbi:MAG TPA: hypothetical protein VGO39_02180 [Gaiellaceae bacterium]|jgi:hypothetical protein|nr:hypothetical protein [Gaiellaceae bacterium]
MPWRSKRDGGRAEQALSAATVARVTGDEEFRATGEEAVRGVLARAELERPIEVLAVVVLEDAPLAEQVAAALRSDREVSVVRLEAVEVGAVDAAFAVVPASMPAQAVIDALRPLDSILLGVVLAGNAPAPAPEALPVSTFDAELEEHLASTLASPVHEGPVERPDAALEALAELERAAVISGPPPAPPAPTTASSPVLDVERKLAELMHREVALRRLTQAVEDQRTRLEERERALERKSPPAPAVDDGLREELEEAIRRAERAEQRVRELGEQVADLATRLESTPPPAPGSLPAEVVEEPATPTAPPAAQRPPDDGTYNIRAVEELVRDAQLRGDPHAEEWAYYLPLLREHADLDGRLPARFDALIDSVFAM